MKRATYQPPITARRCWSVIATAPGSRRERRRELKDSRDIEALAQPVASGRSNEEMTSGDSGG